MGPPLKPIPAVDEQVLDGCSTNFDDENEYQLPTLEELGIEMPEESSSVLFPGGETEALRRLDEHMEKEVCILCLEFNYIPVILMAASCQYFSIKNFSSYPNWLFDKLDILI